MLNGNKGGEVETASTLKYFIDNDMHVSVIFKNLFVKFFNDQNKALKIYVNGYL